MLSLLQSWVEDSADAIWFLAIINNLIAYDDQNIGTDYDNADAIGYGLMRIVDMKRDPREADKDMDSFDDLPVYEEKDGILIDKTLHGRIDKNDPQAHLWIGETYKTVSKEFLSDLD